MRRSWLRLALALALVLGLIAALFAFLFRLNPRVEIAVHTARFGEIKVNKLKFQREQVTKVCGDLLKVHVYALGATKPSLYLACVSCLPQPPRHRPPPRGVLFPPRSLSEYLQLNL